MLLLPPCINRSTDRYAVVDPDAYELLTAGSATSINGAIRVPLTAIRGLGTGTVRQLTCFNAVPTNWRRRRATRVAPSWPWAIKSSPLGVVL